LEAVKSYAVFGEYFALIKQNAIEIRGGIEVDTPVGWKTFSGKSKAW
jgi:hypothetical protein